MSNLLTQLIKLAYIREPETRDYKKECIYGPFNNEVADKTVMQLQRTYTKQQLKEQAEKDNKAYEARLKNYQKLPREIRDPDSYDDVDWYGNLRRFPGGRKARRREINRTKKELLEYSKRKRDWSRFLAKTNYAHDADPIDYKQQSELIRVGGDIKVKKKPKQQQQRPLTPLEKSIDAYIRNFFRREWGLP